MPSLDSYQNLQLDDDDGLSSWLLAHRSRHQTYAYAASLQGTSIGPYDFEQYPDDTWFANHAGAHAVLQQFAIPDQTIDVTVLTNYTWDNQPDFDYWMQMHTLMHQRLDEAFGVFS
jgi:hypothetical protein